MKRKDTSEKEKTRYLTFDGFVPNPNKGMWSFNSLEEYSEAIGEPESLMISRDRRTIVAYSDSMYFIYEGEELVDGISQANKNLGRT